MIIKVRRTTGDRRRKLGRVAGGRVIGALLIALACGSAGCGGCHEKEAVSPPPAPTAAPAAAAAPAAPAAPEAAAAPAGGEAKEIDCFVIVDGEPDFGAPPLTVNFVTETDCTGEPVTFSWDFGDGAKGGNDPKPSHIYEKPGDYIATVTATAPDGGQGTDEIDITVDADLDN